MKTEACPDVRSLARGKWRVRRNPEASPASRDPWDFSIIGANGTICPWGDGLLAVCIDGHTGLCARLSRELWVVSSQYGDDGINAVFREEHLCLAVRYIKAYRKRVLTPEQRERAAAILKKAR